jgi:hypothetical protein
MTHPSIRARTHPDKIAYQMARLMSTTITLPDIPLPSGIARYVDDINRLRMLVTERHRSKSPQACSTARTR